MFQMKVWKTMEADPLFQHSPRSPTLDEFRRITTARFHRVKDWNFISDEVIMMDPRKVCCVL